MKKEVKPWVERFVMPDSPEAEAAALRLLPVCDPATSIAQLATQIAYLIEQFPPASGGAGILLPWQVQVEEAVTEALYESGTRTRPPEALKRHPTIILPMECMTCRVK